MRWTRRPSGLDQQSACLRPLASSPKSAVNWQPTVTDEIRNEAISFNPVTWDIWEYLAIFGITEKDLYDYQCHRHHKTRKPVSTHHGADPGCLCSGKLGGSEVHDLCALTVKAISIIFSSSSVRLARTCIRTAQSEFVGIE